MRRKTMRRKTTGGSGIGFGVAARAEALRRRAAATQQGLSYTEEQMEASRAQNEEVRRHQAGSAAISETLERAVAAAADPRMLTVVQGAVEQDKTTGLKAAAEAQVQKRKKRGEYEHLTAIGAGADGQYLKAVETFDAALQLDPDNKDIQDKRNAALGDYIFDVMSNESSLRSHGFRRDEFNRWCIDTGNKENDYLDHRKLTDALEAYGFCGYLQNHSLRVDDIMMPYGGQVKWENWLILLLHLRDFKYLGRVPYPDSGLAAGWYPALVSI